VFLRRYHEPVEQPADVHDQLVVGVVSANLESIEKAIVDLDDGDTTKASHQVAKPYMKILRVRGVGAERWHFRETEKRGTQNLIPQYVSAEAVELAVGLTILEGQPS
jgi:hypothetical protein